MKWNRGWHAQESKLINVGEAIRLRDNPSLICASNSILGPRSIVDIRPPTIRTLSIQIIVLHHFVGRLESSRNKGESWKHAMVVDEIAFYLMGEGREKYNVDNVKLGDKKSEPDLIVTHSEQLDGFKGFTSYIIVPMYNLRRSRELFFKYSPNSVV